MGGADRARHRDPRAAGAGLAGRAAAVPGGPGGRRPGGPPVPAPPAAGRCRLGRRRAGGAGRRHGGGRRPGRAAPPGRAGDPDRDGRPGTPTATAPAGLPATAPAAFDPLVRTLGVGWLPPGVLSDQWELTADRQTYAAAAPGEGDVGLLVSVFARGQRPPAGEGAPGVPREPVERPTTPVRGRPAVCLAEPQLPASCSTLRWQYAPGAWAQVSYASVSRRSSAPPRRATRTRPPRRTRSGAASGRVGDADRGRAGAAAVPLTGGTARLVPTRTLVEVRRTGRGSWGDRWSASITLDDAPVPAGADLDQSRRGVTVGVLDQPGGAADSPAGRESAPNTTVSGRPAFLSADGRELVLRDRGTRIFVGVHLRPVPAADRYRDVRLLADPADLGSWTDRPLG